MTEREERLLGALVGMAAQYLGEPGNAEAELDTLCMSAGEATLEVLAAYGLVTLTRGGRCGVWTADGQMFRDAH